LLAEAWIVLIQLVDEVELVAADRHKRNRRSHVLAYFGIPDIAGKTL
jgi:hypothetical protein